MDTTATFPPDFFFGVSNAAHQVEDQCSDSWMRFAKRGRIPSYHSVNLADEKIRFWSHPEIDLDLAKELGCQVFRLSLAWERLVPEMGVWNESAAIRYREILSMIKARGMKVMLTLFHHSVPQWFEDQGGWTNSLSVQNFKFYSTRAHSAFADLVDYWITLNEPVPWSFLSYVEGVFPPGVKGKWRDHFSALHHMVLSHDSFYYLPARTAPVGIAHHIGHHQGRGLLNQAFAKVTDHLTHWQFADRVCRTVEFFGINYYGAEWMTLQGPAQYDDLEYSDAGRAVDPNGLAYILKKIHKRYPWLPVIVTENGVGDGTDQLRPAYLIEHLVAISSTIKEGVPVKGYIHWTLSDNFEWSDGYGPKFGLVEIRRDNNLERIKRPSFSLYQHIISDHHVSRELRERIWDSYKKVIGQTRPYWRSSDGKSGREVALQRVTPDQDWRFK